jgi:DNA invertase Pin-like site-specific DNA recombinase
MKIGYVRTSTDELNPENQVMKIRQETHDDKIVIFKDIGVSGYKIKATEREGFKSMINFIQSNDVEKVYVSELSRFGRTLDDTYEAIRYVEKLGPIVLSLSPKESFMNIEDKSMRQLLMSIILWAAEREHDYMVARTIQGIKRFKEENGRWGRKHVVIDWNKVKKMREEGHTWTAISIALKVSSTTLNREKFEKGYERDPRGIRKEGDEEDGE